ncbi:MAG: hypothetical protein OQK48_04490 [Sulfurimonas sp.]|uniref:hypothetical protein n=1 Tax=Sulfurimonas sp. TaxID=2022749 RepID=UPI002635CDFC|nr:hypothetical protein [Sulfurimonas sp.]MCW8895990.1 hypothetical protein [Sulfurimonas sp.]MCW8954180.1 hypothetical protein [Sulfurimonas sp.]MCW9067001.1 hypothetical protein [Sulfurimonas sp.]
MEEKSGDSTPGVCFLVNAGEGTIDDNDDETVLHVNITSVNTVEGDLDDNNQLTFIIGASRELKDTESVTLNLNINDISTDGSDYGFLSQDTITLNSTNQYQTITLDVFGDEVIANNYLHVDMKEVA